MLKEVSARSGYMHEDGRRLYVSEAEEPTNDNLVSIYVQRSTAI